MINPLRDNSSYCKHAPSKSERLMATISIKNDLHLSQRFKICKASLSSEIERSNGSVFNNYEKQKRANLSNLVEHHERADLPLSLVGRNTIYPVNSQVFRTLSGLYLARDTWSLLFRNKSHCEMEPSLSIVTRDSPPCDLAPPRSKHPRAIKLRVIPEDDRVLRNARKPRPMANTIKTNPTFTFPFVQFKRFFYETKGSMKIVG